MLRIIIAAFLLTMAGCSRAKPSAAISYRDGVATVRGPIDDAMLRSLEQISTKGIHKLIITSRGGTTSIAIRIANLLGVGKYDIVVRGYCLSACASVLFMAADHRALEDGSLLILHGTDFAKMQLAHRSINPRHLVWSPIEQADSEKEARILRLRGISPVLFELAELRRNPLCFADADADEPGNIASMVNGTTGYMPSLGTLRRFGVSVSGRELTARERGAKIDELERAIGAKFSVSFDNPADMPSEAEIARIFDNVRMRECSAELTKQVVGRSKPRR